VRAPTLTALLEGVPNLSVSSRVWTLRANAGLEGAKNVALNWGNIFPPDCEPGCARLVREAKTFFAWFLNEQFDKCEELSAATLRNYFTDLRVLLVWMSRNGIFRLKKFPEARVTEYLLFRNSSQYGDAQHATRSLKGKVRLLRILKRSFSKIGIGVQFDADACMDQRLVTKLAHDNRWKPLPDELAIPLLKDCVAWIRGSATPFLDVIETCQSQKCSTVAMTLNERKSSDHRLIKRVCTPATMLRLAESLQLPGETTWGTLLRLGRKETTAACCFILLFFTGIRVSELLALRRGCIAQLPHADGQTFPYLVGVISKGGVRRHQWVAYELIGEAVQLLERINAPIFAMNGDDRLLAAPPAGSVLMHKGMRFSRKRVRDINDLLKAFARAPHRTVPIMSRVHSHQGRETFAQFVGYRDKSGLDALACHFAHAQRRVTDSSYLGNDVDLSRMMAEKDRLDLGRALEDILCATNIAGGAGDHLSKRFRSEAFRGKEAMQATVERLIKQGVRLAPCNWGYCLYRAELSSCRGDSQGPNEINRTPSVCKSCSNFSVTKKHANWWEIRLQRSQDFLANNVVPQMTQQLVQGRIDECEEILNKIDVERQEELG
jgi:integrase